MSTVELFAELKGRSLEDALATVGRMASPASVYVTCAACDGNGKIEKKRPGHITAAQARQLCDDLVSAANAEADAKAD